MAQAVKLYIAYIYIYISLTLKRNNIIQKPLSMKWALLFVKTVIYMYLISSNTFSIDRHRDL